MEHVKLYSHGDLEWVAFSRDQEKSDEVIDTVEYVIISKGEAMALDPGGTEVFPQIISAISDIVPIGQIKSFLCSHQDPDVLSSLPLWMGLCGSAKIYVSWLWKGFIVHFGSEYVDNFVVVPDEGMDISFNSGHVVKLIPAHYCHSPGNFSLYDPVAKILFSGDIGAALLPDDYRSMFVEDASTHIQYMETFHRRWMPSNSAKNDWIARVRELDVKMLCPQHGAIFRDDQVGEFLDWLEQLEVGCAITRSAA